MASLLYSFTRPHFAPGQGHLMYCVFFPAPLIIIVILWLCSECKKHTPIDIIAIAILASICGAELST
jgi:hypothetical protein